ncbi:unnamed protein product [Polarella glacialis]|uniref:Uncharacterized protein n=1 Tax=Polarella glacialis TaxID=89957 RepID=A0A813FZX9_POLGL|nr:unnamed protein product [Polarella glacialis]CAE8698520.1 unnamed protein product [Polarella glacialis]
MCFPPFCHPATHVLGCFGLRKGAAAVLVLNASYGLALVVVHALLLGERDPGEAGGSSEQAAQPSYQSAERNRDYGGRRLAGSSSTGWLIQLIDLDIGWGHRLLDMDDQTNLVSGLMYGIVVILFCGYMFYQVQHTGSGSLPTTTRWCVAFMNLEMLLYVGLCFVKFEKLCQMQAMYMPDLDMKCPVQRYMYLERVIIYIIAGSLCIWIFSSFAFSLTFGHTMAMDRPEFAHELDTRDAMVTGNGSDPHGQFGGPGGAGLGPSPYQTRQNLAQHGGSAAASRHSLVGGAVHAQSFQSQSMRDPRSMPAHGQSMPAHGHSPQRTSYNIGNMARAGSSMVSTTSDLSHQGHSEMQSLIKPPLHVF